MNRLIYTYILRRDSQLALLYWLPLPGEGCLGLTSGQIRSEHKRGCTNQLVQGTVQDCNHMPRELYLTTHRC